MDRILLVFLSTIGVGIAGYPPQGYVDETKAIIDYGGLPAEERCTGSADVVFVLDESSSIDRGDFKEQLTFVKGLVGDFNVGSGGVHVGVITFSTNVKVAIPLREYTDENRLKEDIAKIDQTGGDTYTNRALERLRQEMSYSKSARPGVRHIAIIITDGQSTRPDDTKTEAKICHAQHPDYEMFAIGVGKNASKQELEDIASSKNKVFSVGAYGELESQLRQILASETCKKRCTGAADVVFVLDESGSIASSDFKEQLTFVQGLVGDFNVGSGGIHVGVITFATGVQVEIPLGQHTNEGELKEKIAKISQEGGSTYTNLALERLRQEMSYSKSARPGVRHIAIIITDGQSTEPAKTKTEAKICHAQHPDYEMFAIGVGNSVSKQELEDIASSKNKVFTVDAFANLESHLHKILASETCETPEPPKPLATETPTGKVPGCSRYKYTKIDLIWSISVRADTVERNYALEFINWIITELQTWSIRVQVGLAPKFCYGEDGIVLHGYDTILGFWRELEQSRLAAVRSDSVIQYIRLEGFGRSVDAVRFGILIVDNTEVDWENTVNEARLARDEGIRLVVIGVGSRVDPGRLRGLAWTDSDYFSVSCYAELRVIKIQIIQRICVENSQSVLRKSLLESLYDF